MNNIVYEILPFLLFGAVLGMLLKGRFSRLVSRAVFYAAFGAVGAVHLVLGLLSLDNALLLSLMPLTAYLPLSAVYFFLSKRSIAERFFTLFIGIIAGLIAELAEKLYVPLILNAVGGIGADILCLFLSVLVSAAPALVAFFFLRRLFFGGTIIGGSNWYLNVALFFLIVLSLYLKDSPGAGGALLMLLCDLSVFGVIAGYLNARVRGEKLQLEREQIERQIEAEREEYRRIEQGVELGRRYRHDMRHHFSVLGGLMHSGNTREAEAYLNTLGEQMSVAEQRPYCSDPTVNAVLSPLIMRAEEAGIRVKAHVALPQELPVCSSDLCSLLSNLIENAVEAASLCAEGERRLLVLAECREGKRLIVSVENSVRAKVALDQDGMPSAPRREGHGYGLASVRFIVEKYNGVLRCEAGEDTFSVRAVLFFPVEEPHGKRQRGVRLRAAAAIPALIAALVLSLNCMPSTLSALKQVPVLGSAAAAVDFRGWGLSWGGSGIRVEEPELSFPSEEIDACIEACVEEFWRYFAQKYSGYAGEDLASTVIREDDRSFTLCIQCTINAGSSFTCRRHFTVDKATGEIVSFESLFREGSGYNEAISAEIGRQIEERVERGDFYYGYGIFTSPADLEMAFRSLQDPDFYFDEEGRLVIAFQEGEIAPNNMGTPAFVIPAGVTEPLAAEGSLLTGGNI